MSLFRHAILLVDEPINDPRRRLPRHSHLSQSHLYREDASIWQDFYAHIINHRPISAKGHQTINKSWRIRQIIIIVVAVGAATEIAI